MVEKALIRKETLQKRDAIDSAARKAKDLLIKDRLFSLPEIHKAGIIFFFASFRSEVSTFPMMEEAYRLGKRIVLPRVDRKIKGLALYEVKGLSELSPGCMDIPEPNVPEERRMDINGVDVIIMPGVAFDQNGNRIGYGAGFYDKLLSGLKKQTPLIAITYEEQVLDSVPSEPHDIKVHKIVTDKRALECSVSAK